MSPFDWRSVLLARHAQHVVLIHFPIALFIVGAIVDVVGTAWRQTQLRLVAYANFCMAAVSTIPAVATGLIAWQWALEGQHLKGTLLLHLICGVSAGLAIWGVCVLEWLARRETPSRAAVLVKFALEFLGVGLLGLAGHLGGFLSGVNGAM